VTRPISDAAAESFAIGLVLQMEKRDIPGRFSSDPLQRFGNHRTVRGRAGTVLTVAVDDGFDAIAADPGGLRLVAYQGAHSRPVRARIVARRRARLAQLDADRKAGRIDDEHFEAAKFNAPDPGHAVAVFEGPPGA
jgi:hypothetical protein